jgi:hypothetical protein
MIQVIFRLPIVLASFLHTLLGTAIVCSLMIARYLNKKCPIKGIFPDAKRGSGLAGSALAYHPAKKLSLTIFKGDSIVCSNI